MPETDFDPYYKWLGIPPAEQPPNHYRLLGLQLFEADPDVIANATDRQMAHIRTFQTGRHAAQSQQILNEFAAAKVCLLRPEKKAEYDRALRARQAPPADADYTEAITAEPLTNVEPAAPVAPKHPASPQPAAPRVASGSSPNLNRPRPVQPAPGQGARPVPVRPLQPVPMQAVPVAPVEAASDFSAVESLVSQEKAHGGAHARRRQAKKSPLSNPLVLGGGAGALVLLAIIFVAFSGGDQPQPAQATQHGSGANALAVNEDPQPADTTDPQTSTSQQATQPPTTQSSPGTSQPVAVDPANPTAANSGEPHMLRFDGGDYVEIKNTADLVNLSQPFTVEMWVRMPSLASSQCLFGTRMGQLNAANSTGWEINAARNAQQLVDFGFSCTHATRGGETPLAVKNVRISPQWHHVAICGDSTNLRFRIDGQAMLVGVYDRSKLSLGSSNLFIGPSPASGESSTSGFQVRAFRLSSGVRYPVSFTPAQTFVRDSQTLALFDFTSGGGDLLTDLSGEGHDGQIVGATWSAIAPHELVAGPTAMVVRNVTVQSPSTTPRINTPVTPANPANPNTSVATGNPATGNPTTSDPAGNKLPTPADAEVSKARALVRELFQSDITAAKTPDEKARLAQTLLSQAEKTADDTTAQYALCLEALPLGISGNNWPLVLQIIDTIDGKFKIDALGMKTDALAEIAKTARTPLAKQQIILVGLEGLDTAIAAERNDLAAKLMTTLQATAVDVRDPELRRRVAARASELRKAQQEWAALTDAANQVKNKPNDPTANLTYGKLLCLSKGRWDEGLPYLAKSGDAALVEAAQLDLSKPTAAADRIKAGDLWWTLAENDKTAAKTGLELRAGFWYEQGVAQLAGLNKIKIEKRLETVRALAIATGNQDQSISIDVGPGITMPLRLVRPGEVQAQTSGNVIKVDAPYYIGVTECTQAQWLAVIGSNLSGNQTNLACPVDHVSFDDVANFLDQLTQRNAGKFRFRLPTAAEWEYACRAGSSATYYYGADQTRLREFAWISENSQSDTHPVGQLKPNAFGLYDMLGNVREMCMERDQPIYASRGGAYTSSGMSAACSSSSSISRTSQLNGVGFRVACDAGTRAGATIAGATPATPGATGAATTTTPATTTASIPLSSVATPSGSMPGMIGSVMVNGQKTGLAITYTPGKCFRQQLIDDELRKVGLVDASAFSRTDVIAMTGTIRVTKQTPAIVWLATGDDFYTTGVTVSIDRQKVFDYRDSSRHNSTNRIMLTRGDHEVIWQLSGGNIGECALQFVDADTKQPLTIFYPKEAALAKNNARASIDQSTEVGLPASPAELR